MHTPEIWVETRTADPYSVTALIFYEDGESFTYHLTHYAILTEPSEEFTRCSNASEAWDIVKTTYWANSVTKRSWDAFLEEYI